MAKELYTYKNPITGDDITIRTNDTKHGRLTQQAINYILNNGFNHTFEDARKLETYINGLGMGSYYTQVYNDAMSLLVQNGISPEDLNKYYETHNKTSTDKVLPTYTVNNKTQGITDNIGAATNDVLTFTYVDPSTGKVREGTIGDSTKYNYTKGSTPNQTNSSVYYAIEYMLKNGQVDPNNKTEREALEAYLESKTKGNITNASSKNAIEDALLFFNTNDVALSALGNNQYYSENSNLLDTVSKYSSPENVEQVEQETEESAQEAAYNSYYRDIYGYNTEGTLGNEIYNNLWQAEQNAAMSNMQLAEAQYQQAAMDQAAVVKSITDQVKSERMARLKAGMNEAQIANQDMQIMLNNMNTLNQQVNTLNQNRLAAQQQYSLAQDTAYQQYLNTASGMAQSAAAFAASDAGDAYMQTLKRMSQTGESFNKAYNYITGQTTGGK